MARGAGDFAIAYIIHKATMPIRVPITLAVVPIVARVVRSKKKFWRVINYIYFNYHYLYNYLIFIKVIII